MANKGYVYVLTNPCFKDNWVKIGKTNDLDRRIFELSQATGVPLSFEKYAVLKTIKYDKAETMIHRLIGKLAPDKRINPKREFFNIEPEDAVSILKDVAELLDDAEIIYFGDNQTEQKSIKNHSKKPPRTFYNMGIKDGDTIYFIPAPQYKATVCGERTVMFENKEYFLSTLGYTLAKRMGKSEQEARNIYSGGFGNFKFNDEDIHLYARSERINSGNKYDTH